MVKGKVKRLRFTVSCYDFCMLPVTAPRVDWTLTALLPSCMHTSMRPARHRMSLRLTQGMMETYLYLPPGWVPPPSPALPPPLAAASTAPPAPSPSPQLLSPTLPMPPLPLCTQSPPTSPSPPQQRQEHQQHAAWQDGHHGGDHHQAQQQQQQQEHESVQQQYQQQQQSSKPPPLDLSQTRVAGLADPHHSTPQQHHHQQCDGSSTPNLDRDPSTTNPWHSPHTPYSNMLLPQTLQQQQQSRSSPISNTVASSAAKSFHYDDAHAHVHNPLHHRARSAAACRDNTSSAPQLVSFLSRGDVSDDAAGMIGSAAARHRSFTSNPH